ncbi:MAG: PadR family transcriptional regulator [Candidatus Aenigmarchaeota archaeon]|nr:PadR family transcriptional regulator [Candidatus Aenigmarchaeota archaeon]
MRTPVERLKEKVQKENLWFFVCYLLEKRDRYGYEIRNLVKERFGFLAGNVTAYKVLYLLNHDGYVRKSSKGNRVYYSITQKGRSQLKKARKFFGEMKRF